MARPNKATVEYFPLVCQFGDSIQAIENIYGNDGFVVWVKLLQKLGRTEKHYIDLRTNAAWKLFYSIFKIEEFEVKNILDTLAELECIDQNLWRHKIIYSQNFVDGITDAYRNRKYTPLGYEEILRLVGINDVRNSQEDGVSYVRNPISDVRNPQSKLKETKVKESKEKVVVDSNSRSAKAPATHEKTEIVSGNQATTTTNFSKPTLDEVRVYAAERGNKANPDKFHAHYEGKDWEINGALMRDWKAAFRYWEQNERKNTKSNVLESIPPNLRPECKPIQKVEFLDGVSPDEVDSIIFQQWREKAKKRI